MGIRNAELQNGLILHTILEGKVSGEDLIPFYSKMIKSGKMEKYYLELIDGCRVEEFSVTDQDQKKLAAYFKKYFEAIFLQRQKLAAGEIDLPGLKKCLPKLIVNGHCNENVSSLLGLKRNCQIVKPPSDAPTLFNLVDWHLERLANYKLAMCADNEKAFSIFKLWEERQQSLGYAIKAFDNISEGAGWLLEKRKNNQTSR